MVANMIISPIMSDYDFILKYKVNKSDKKSLGRSVFDLLTYVALTDLPPFSKMNYKKLYQQLIDRSREEKRFKGDGRYYENHHIIPRCLKGNDDPENLVLLTAREHFIAHWILTKLYPDNSSIIFAFNSFAMKLHGATNPYGKLDSYSTSRNYESARQKVIQIMKFDKEVRKRIRIGSQKRHCDTTFINNGTENKRVKKDSLQEYLDNGWLKGRIKYTRKPHSIETRRKISLSNKKPASEERKQKLKEFAKNNPHVWISKNNESKQVYICDLQQYLEAGWIKGRNGISKDFDTSAYVKYNDLYKKILKDDLQLYLKYGWEQTTLQDFKTNGSKKFGNLDFLLWVNKDNKSFRICKYEIEIYKEKGYNIGRGKRKRG